MKGRFLASLLAISMIMQLVPVVAFGADEMALGVPAVEEEMEIVEFLEPEVVMELAEVEEVEEVEEAEEIDAELMEEVAEIVSVCDVGSCGDNAIWVYDDTTYTLTISGTGDMEDYTFTSVPWFSYRRDIKNVVITEGVTSIWSCAFYGCSSLESITIPEGITSIGEYAFYNCSSLENITIPEGITSIEDSAFYNCSNLINITIPAGVTSIGNYAFGWCSSLESIVIPAGVTSIGNYAFLNCSSLESIAIPEGVTSIGKDAFSDCSSLKSIIIPAGVTTIESNSFSFCSNLESIAIPARVTSIGNYAFYKCSSLIGITLPEGVTSIGSSTFYECSNLESIAIPEGVTSIEGGTFCGCSSLESIIIPKEVISIGKQTFDECSSLTDVYYAGSESDWNAISIDTYNTYLTDATIHYNWGDNSIGYDFVLQSDNNSFVHSSNSSGYGFYGVTDYTISDAAYNNLTKGLSSAKIATITSAMNSSWGGSCYGIAATMGLVADGSLTLSDISSSGTSSYFELPLPWKNTQLLDSINYYQLSQYIIGSTEYASISSCSVVLKALVASLGDGEVSIFCYGYYSSSGSAVGHAILATDVTVNTNGSYTVTLYDMNSVGSTTSGKFTTMTVSSDYKTFSFYSPSGSLMNNDSCRWLKRVDLDEFDSVQEPYDAQLSSAEQTLILSGTEFSVSNEDGETISIDENGVLTIDMEDATVTNIIAYETADGDSSASQILISVPICESYEIASEGAYFEMQLVGIDEFFAIEGEDIATVIMDFDDGIAVSGKEEKYTFTASILASGSEEEVNLVSISATATADTVISEKANTITAESEEKLTNPSMVSMTGVTKIELLDQEDEDDTVISVNPDADESGEVVEGDIINLFNVAISGNEVTFKVEIVGAVNVADLKVAIALYNTEGQMIYLNIESITEGQNTISIDSMSYEAAKLFTMDANNKPILTAIDLTAIDLTAIDLTAE